MYVVYPGGQLQNKPMLFWFLYSSVSVPPIVMVLYLLPKHAGWVVRSVKTNTHPDQTATSLHEQLLVILTSLCAFFATVVAIRTVDPMFRSGPFHSYFHQCLADGVRMNLVSCPTLLVTYFCQHFQCP